MTKISTSKNDPGPAAGASPPAPNPIEIARFVRGLRPFRQQARAWKARLVNEGVPPHLVAHLAATAQPHKEERYDRFSEDVKQLTGDPPMSVLQFGSHCGAPAPINPISGIKGPTGMYS
jgi:hypothetical protein